MKELRTKQFQILTDINLVGDFQTEIYDRENVDWDKIWKGLAPDFPEKGRLGK